MVLLKPDPWCSPVNTPPCHGGDQGFKSPWVRFERDRGGDLDFYMQWEVDKKGIVSTLEIAAAGFIIIFSAHLIAREATLLLTAGDPAAKQTPLPSLAPLDENAFYVEPPGADPVFLDAKALAKKRDALIWDQRDFIAADLDAGRVLLYEKGALRAEFPILGRPEAGGFFDLPAGFYTVQGKSENHISKIRGGRMPWAVYLFGNYLIHGSFAGAGRGARSGVSTDAGIRLASEDARALFARAEPGMPALILRAEQPAKVAFTYFRKTNLPHAVPEVGVASALAADLDTGEILFEKNKNDAYPTASLTKLMTALIARESIPDTRFITADKEALATYGDSAGLVLGEVFRAGDLLYPLILPSSNDVAVMYEQALPDFIARMNERASALGLTRTFFADSSGLSRDNVTSAYDLFLLLGEIDRKRPDILAASRARSYAFSSENKKKSHIWNNINWPAGDPRYLGGKAGFTDDSLQTMAGVWSVRASEYGGRRIAITLLGSRNRIRDVRAVIAYLESDFVYGFAFGKEYQRSGAAILGGAAVYQAVAPVLSR